MKLKHSIWMTGTVSKKAKKEGIEVDEKQFEGMKPKDMRIVTPDHIIGITTDGQKYLKLITGFHLFEEEVKLLK